MDKIEKLRKQYYDAIILLQNEQDILDALPKPDYSNFFIIINGLIERITEEIETLKKEITAQLDNGMKEYMQEEISSLILKKNICNKLLEEATLEKEIQESAEETTTKNIIFATTNNDNICIENDIKDIPKEYYATIIKMLEKLQNGVEETNSEKAKKMKSTNKKIVGIHELKEFKIRLFYKILSKDTVYVLMIRMKKANYDALDRNDVINRVSLINKQYEKIKKLIQYPEIKEELIAENEEMLKYIYDYLNKNRRGK